MVLVRIADKVPQYSWCLVHRVLVLKTDLHVEQAYVVAALPAECECVDITDGLRLIL